MKLRHLKSVMKFRRFMRCLYCQLSYCLIGSWFDFDRHNMCAGVFIYLCMFASLFLSLYHIVDRSLPAVPVKSRVFSDVAIFLFCQFTLDVRVCIYVRVYAGSRTCIHLCQRACVHACVHVCMSVCIRMISNSVCTTLELGRYQNFFDTLRYQNYVRYSILDTRYSILVLQV